MLASVQRKKQLLVKVFLELPRIVNEKLRAIWELTHYADCFVGRPGHTMLPQRTTPLAPEAEHEVEEQKHQKKEEWCVEPIVRRKQVKKREQITQPNFILCKSHFSIMPPLNVTVAAQLYE